MINSAAQMKQALKKQYSGVVLYEGPSMLNGKPIVAIATGIVTKSSNEKTGDMVQTWIIPSDINPHTAIKTGDDITVCGDCKHRPFLGGDCYVNTAYAPNNVYKAYHNGKYARPYIDYDPGILPVLFDGLAFRVGSYGEPVAVPLYVWENCLQSVAFVNGYSHQWKNADFQAFKRFCMASVDNYEEAIMAYSMGWRLFRVRPNGHDIDKAIEFSCPASKEAGKRSSCDKCKACGGLSSKHAKSVTIISHGFRTPKQYRAA